MSDPVYEVVRTRRLDIVDERGNLRISTEATDAGAGLIVMDERAVARAALYHTTSGGSKVEMLGPDGKLRLSIIVDDNGSNLIEIFDSAERVRLVIRVDDGDDGDPSAENVALDLIDQNQEVRVGIGFQSERGNVVIYDGEGTYRAVLGVDAGGYPGLITNKDGLPRP